MKSIKVSFEEARIKNPYMGGILIIANIVSKNFFTRDAIVSNLNKLTKEGVDYFKENKKEIIDWLEKLSKKAK